MVQLQKSMCVRSWCVKGQLGSKYVQCPMYVTAVLAILNCSSDARHAVCAGEVHTNGDASASGRINPLDVPLGGGKSRYSAVVLDSEGVAAQGALRECCVFVVPQARPRIELL